MLPSSSLSVNSEFLGVYYVLGFVLGCGATVISKTNRPRWSSNSSREVPIIIVNKNINVKRSTELKSIAKINNNKIMELERW